MTFEGKLLSISDTISFNKLADGSQGAGFIACTIEFKNKDGVLKTVRSSIYEKEWDKGMEVGKSYVGYAELVDGKPYTHLTHYLATETASADDFDFEGYAARVAEKEAVAKEKAALAEVND